MATMSVVPTVHSEPLLSVREAVVPTQVFLVTSRQLVPPGPCSLAGWDRSLMTTWGSQLGVQMEPVEATLRTPGTDQSAGHGKDKCVPRKPDYTPTLFLSVVAQHHTQ